MRKKSAVKVRPVLRNSDSGVVKPRSGRWIKRESCPEANQNEPQRHQLGAHTCESQQKQEYVSQSNLRQRVFKRKVRLPRPQGPEKDPEKDEDQGAPDRMPKHGSESLSLL